MTRQMLNSIKKDMKYSSIEYYNWKSFILKYTANYYEEAV